MSDGELLQYSHVALHTLCYGNHSFWSEVKSRLGHVWEISGFEFSKIFPPFLPTFMLYSVAASEPLLPERGERRKPTPNH